MYSSCSAGQHPAQKLIAGICTNEKHHRKIRLWPHTHTQEFIWPLSHCLTGVHLTASLLFKQWREHRDRGQPLPKSISGLSIDSLFGLCWVIFPFYIHFPLWKRTRNWIWLDKTVPRKQTLAQAGVQEKLSPGQPAMNRDSTKCKGQTSTWCVKSVLLSFNP